MIQSHKACKKKSPRIKQGRRLVFAVCVTFDIKPGRTQAFLRLMHAQAANSLDREAGCHRFDVCTDGDVADRVFLYELYTDQAAFEAHLQSAHFQTFDAAVGEMIAAKQVSTYESVTLGAD